MPTFCPPLSEDVPSIDMDELARRRNPLGNRLMRHFGQTNRGINVFKLMNGTYVQTQPVHWSDATVAAGNPSPQNTLITYYGGHCYEVDAAEAAALIAAGYTVMGATTTWDSAVGTWDAQTATWDTA